MAMQVPFPELAYLNLSNQISVSGLVLPDSFLGGSAPRLRYFRLHAMSFMGLSKPLLSATHLVKLWLEDIPRSWYISPKVMATCLSMTSLESLHLNLKSPRPHPDLESRHPFTPVRSVLPTLAIFSFHGAVEYLEDFVAWIDALQLYSFSTRFFPVNYTDFDKPVTFKSERSLQRHQTATKKHKAPPILRCECGTEVVRKDEMGSHIKYCKLRRVGSDGNTTVVVVG